MNTFLKRIGNLIIFKKSKTNTLNVGRWNTNDNQNIKSILANSDHCGDNICKDPKFVRYLIDKEINIDMKEYKSNVNKI